jgi:hypothetical protein
MVNILEGLYVLTAIGGMVALVYWLRGRAGAARAWAIGTAALALVAAALYWYVSPGG